MRACTMLLVPGIMIETLIFYLPHALRSLPIQLSSAKVQCFCEYTNRHASHGEYVMQD